MSSDEIGRLQPLGVARNFEITPAGPSTPLPVPFGIGSSDRADKIRPVPRTVSAL